MVIVLGQHHGGRLAIIGWPPRRIRGRGPAPLSACGLPTRSSSAPAERPNPAARQAYPLNRGIDGRPGGAGVGRGRAARHDPSRSLAKVVGKVLSCRPHPVDLITRHTRGRESCTILQSNLLVRRTLIQGRHCALYLRVLDHQETPRLRVAGVCGASPCLQHLHSDSFSESDIR